MSNDNKCDRDDFIATMKGRGLLDMHKVPEDDRIQIIGRMMSCEHCIKKAGGALKIPLLLDDESDKIARYIAKLAEHFPRVRVLKTERNSAPGIATVWLGSPLSA